MGGLLGGSDVPTPAAPPAQKTTENTVENAANAERVRKLRSLGKAQSVFAGELPAMNRQNSKLGGGF